MEQISRKRAKALGLKFFYTGVKCKYGHLSNRYVSTCTCVECLKIREENRIRIWDKKKQTLYNHKYYLNNIERLKQLNKKGYIKRNKKNPEEEKEKRRKSRADYKLVHPDRVKKQKDNWVKNNKLYIFLYAALKRKRTRNATPPWTDKKLIKEKYIEAIRKTKETGIKYVVDHMIPLTHDKVCGLHIHINLQVITEKENLKKYNKFSN